MDKDSLVAKIKELEELLKRVEDKKKAINKELLVLRPQFYKIIEEENRIQKEKEANAPPPDVGFLNDKEWSGFD